MENFNITDSSQLPEHLGYLKHIKIDVLKSLDAAGQVSQTLERQDLEGEMERLNILETPFYERLGKVKASAFEHEYNVVTSRQDKIGYAVYRDGGIPRTVEFEIARRRTIPCLIGQRITMTELTIATTANGVQTIEQTAKDEKIVAVMEEMEYLLFHGDRRFGITDLSSPQNLQFNGIEQIIKQGAPQNVLDLGGKPLSLAALWAAEVQVYQTQGLARPSTVFISPIDKINLQSSFYQIARTNGAERAAGVLGATAQTYISSYGETELVTSRFLGDWHKFTDQAHGAVGGDFARPVPAQTVVSSKATIVLQGLPDGKSYKYYIKSANFNGESMSKETAPVVVALSDVTSQAVIGLTNVDPATKWFIVYRSETNALGVYGTPKYLKRVPYYGSANFEITDDGHETLVSAYGSFRYNKVPGTGCVFGVDMLTTNMAQWIPLEMTPLPQMLTRDWAIRSVTSLFSRAPEFNFAIVNVSQDSLA